MHNIRSYKDLIVWQRAIELTVAVYELTNSFPAEERYGLMNQMRRAAVSIVSNIAEGRLRSSRKDFKNFLHIAFGSGAELETQILIAKKLSYTQRLDYQKVDALLTETMKMLNVLIYRIRETKAEKVTIATGAKT